MLNKQAHWPLVSSLHVARVLAASRNPLSDSRGDKKVLDKETPRGKLASRALWSHI